MQAVIKTPVSMQAKHGSVVRPRPHVAKLAARVRLGRATRGSRSPIVCLARPLVDRLPQPASNLQRLWEKVASGALMLGRGAVVGALALALLVGRAPAADAARSAGRAGGFSGRSAPARSYSGGGGGGGGSMGRSYSSPGYSYGARGLVAPPLAGGIMLAPSPVYMGAGPMVVASPGYGLADAMTFLFCAAIIVPTIGAALSRAPGGVGAGAAGADTLRLTKVQVGLLALARQLKGELDDMASSATTTTSAGLQQLLQECVLALLRNPQYVAYGAVSQVSAGSDSELERAFNAASLSVRSRFEEETLTNVRGRRARASAPRAPRGGGAPDELIVVTLLVASQGGDRLPARVTSLAELQAVLRSLGSLGSDQVLGVELMWTPQAEGDHFSRDEIAADFPELVPL